MRIIDWSSDVCSSDLRAFDQRLGVPDLEEIHHPPEEGEIGDAGFETGTRRQDEAAAAVEGHCLRRARAAQLAVVINLPFGSAQRQFPSTPPFLEYAHVSEITAHTASFLWVRRDDSSGGELG